MHIDHNACVSPGALVHANKRLTACTLCGTVEESGTVVKLKKVPAFFWRTATGIEPVRDWLGSLDKEDRRTIGGDIATLEYGWPVGMPTCRPMGDGLFEVRSNLQDGRIGRVLFCFADGCMVLLHGFIKKTRNTPSDDLALAQRRKRERER
jgi:phage-related protein